LQARAGIDDAELRARAVTAEQRDVRVGAAVLGAADIRRILGAGLDQTRVQPVWIEVRNGTSQPLWLLRSGTDPDYYSPREVAWELHVLFAGGANARVDDHFDDVAFKCPVAPGTTEAGILFTNPQHRTKVLNLDLLGRRTLVPFTLLVPVPGETAAPLFQYPSAENFDYSDLPALRAALERLPGCATDSGRVAPGDPLNVVVVGEFDAIGAAAVRRDYRRDAQAEGSTQRVFDRPPDFVVRKKGQVGAPSTTLRAWLAPISFEGRPIYLVQAGRPIGGRFTSRDASDVALHGDVDEARNLMIQDMVYSGGLQRLGFVTGVGAASETQPRCTFNGAHYFTDGLRAVLFFATRPLSLADVEFLDWVPYLTRSEAEAGARQEKADARQPPDR
jgi:hypothetical protein